VVRIFCTGIKTGMALDPAKRFQNAAAFDNALALPQRSRKFTPGQPPRSSSMLGRDWFRERHSSVHSSWQPAEASVGRDPVRKFWQPTQRPLL
jgi:hypothetical protein